LQCVAVFCSASQCVAARCNALQCVALRCSALQCVAVRCSLMQRVAAANSPRHTYKCIVEMHTRTQRARKQSRCVLTRERLHSTKKNLSAAVGLRNVICSLEFGR